LLKLSKNIVGDPRARIRNEYIEIDYLAELIVTEYTRLSKEAEKIVEDLFIAADVFFFKYSGNSLI